MTKEKRELLLNHWANGLGTSAICERLGIAKKTLEGIIKKARTAGDPRAAPRRTLVPAANQGNAIKKAGNDRWRMAQRHRKFNKHPWSLSEMTEAVARATVEVKRLKPGFAMGVGRIARGL